MKLLLILSLLLCGNPLVEAEAEEMAAAAATSEVVAPAESVEVVAAEGVTTVETAASVVAASSEMPAASVKLDGHTHITVAGKEETRDGMVLKVNFNGNVASVGMYDFQILTFKGLTFEGDLTLDSEGNVRSFSNVKIKGFSPIKVTSVTGKLTEKGADLLVEGKAAVAFNFTIKYWN
jgi:hypothetical protein